MVPSQNGTVTEAPLIMPMALKDTGGLTDQTLGQGQMAQLVSLIAMEQERFIIRTVLSQKLTDGEGHIHIKMLMVMLSRLTNINWVSSITMTDPLILLTQMALLHLQIDMAIYIHIIPMVPVYQAIWMVRHPYITPTVPAHGQELTDPYRHGTVKGLELGLALTDQCQFGIRTVPDIGKMLMDRMVTIHPMGMGQ
jgi:hypothetical protein